ncbi:dihydrofolate reductase [Candidatus Peregrinibacteria bacterium]|nr:dihydrofolate reductase [Candidatus Peregrinibacteria bacterium]
MINNHNLYIIVAADQELGIGKDGKMPWNLKNELKHFQEVTTKTEDPDKENMVLMGRTTWDSIPESHRPLKNRKNVVLTRNPDFVADGAVVAKSLEEAFLLADDKTEDIYVIGGGRVYSDVTSMPQLDGIYLTQIHDIFECDTHFPVIPKSFGEPVNMGGSEDDETKYNYLFYKRQA